MSLVRYTPKAESKFGKIAKALGVESLTSIIDRKNEDGTYNLIVTFPAQIGGQTPNDYAEDVPASEIEEPK
jgi:hypothetical protein